MFTVVLVDDEMYTLKGLKKTFDWEKYGFEVIGSFMDPVEAISFIEKNKPDVIFLDIEMPEMTGIELLKIIREKNIKSDVVIVSAHSNFAYAQESIFYGAFEYLLKPVNREKGEALLKRLKSSIDSKSKSYITSNDDIELDSIKNENFKMLINFINEHYNDNLTLNDLAQTYNLNATYCCRLFVKYYNCNFTEYLRNIRMAKACELLKEDYEIADVAENVGYNDYYHFCKIFKKTYGITPYKYKVLNKR